MIATLALPGGDGVRGNVPTYCQGAASALGPPGVRPARPNSIVHASPHPGANGAAVCQAAPPVSDA